MQTTRSDERLAVASTRVAYTEVTLVAMAGRVQLVGLEPTPVTETIQNDFSGMLTRNPAELDAAPGEHEATGCGRAQRSATRRD